MTRFIATAKRGKLDWGSLSNEARLSQHLKDNEGKSYRLEKVQGKRSVNQNSFYWLYLEVISREVGHTPQELHELFKRTLLPPKVLNVLHREFKMPASTTELTKTEMSEYMERICAETNVPIPNPQDLEALGYIMNDKPMR